MNDPADHCLGDRRRPHVRASEAVNGIDYVELERIEVGGERRLRLNVVLLRPLPTGTDVPLFARENVLVAGGPSGEGLEVLGEPEFVRAPDPARDDVAVVLVNDPGDQASYTLRLVETPAQPLVDVDPRYRSADFSLAAGTPIDVDCLPASVHPQPRHVTPELSHLAKDYASFRRLVLDRLATTLPDWHERHAADLYLTLVEVLAYQADRLSYAQDAVGTEAYLDTARLRTSVRRHARLVDYAMHEGCNARTWACLTVEGDPVVAADGLSFVTRPAGVDPEGVTLLPDALARAPRTGYEVFEPLLPVGPAPVTEHDVLDPRGLVQRLVHGEGSALDYVRSTLPEQERELFARDDLGEEELPTLIATVAGRLDALLRDVGLVRAVPETTRRALQRHGSLNALSGPLLSAHNRAELQGALPELGGPAHLRFHAAHNRMTFYTWDLTGCCLPAGATSATLLDAREDGSDVRRLRHLRPGDVLVLEEVLGPRSGLAADADPARRHAVRLTGVGPGLDRLRDVPVVEVSWAREDALPFPFVLSAVGPPPECALIEDITVARGNALLVDHGETVREPDPVRLRDRDRTTIAVPFPAPHDVVPSGAIDLCCTGESAPAEARADHPAYEPVLSRSPVVFAEPLVLGTSATDALRQDPRLAVPALTVFGPVAGRCPAQDAVDRQADAAMVRPATVRYERWEPRRDLLSSGPDDRHVVVEVDDERVAHLRFGPALAPGPEPGTRMLAAYRVGGGTAGNVGAGAVRHVVLRDRPRGGRITGVTNPLPASGGTDPEVVDEVRLRAPHAFRTRLERAVVAEDYAAITERDFPDDVQRATAEIGVREVAESGDVTVVTVLVDPRGATTAVPELCARIEQHLERYRRIGHVVEVAPATYVVVDLGLEVRLRSGHQPGAVLAAIRDRLSNRTLRDGTRGFFHPDELTFGRPVAISAVLGAVHSVPGVLVGRVVRLARRSGGDALPADDVLRVGPQEIVRLDDDPDRPENGALTIALEEEP